MVGSTRDSEILEDPARLALQIRKLMNGAVDVDRRPFLRSIEDRAGHRMKFVRMSVHDLIDNGLALRKERALVEHALHLVEGCVVKFNGRSAKALQPAHRLLVQSGSVGIAEEFQLARAWNSETEERVERSLIEVAGVCLALGKQIVRIVAGDQLKHRHAVSDRQRKN